MDYFLFLAGGASLAALVKIVQDWRWRQSLKRAEQLPGLGEALPAMREAQYGTSIYLDYNATTPIFPEVSAAMVPYMNSCFGNPSSGHVFAAPCREAISKARSLVAELVNAQDPDDTICFTSCGTESDNMAIRIAINHYYSRINSSGAAASAPHIVTSAIEHPAVLVYLRSLEQAREIHLTVVPVDGEGFVSAGDVAKALRENTCCVTIMHSNNEVGTLQPIREIGRHIRSFNKRHNSHVLLHSDAAQSLGKGVDVDVEALLVDLVTIVGHKMGAPKGVAALYIRQGICCGSVGTAGGGTLLVGGGQEKGRRSGTENIMLIAALGEAARIARVESRATLLRMVTLKRRLVLALRSKLAQACASLSPSLRTRFGFGAGDGERIAQQLVRFNGPRRCADAAELESDLAILRIISHHKVPPPSKSDSSSGSIPSAAISSTVPASLTLEQLPNTISVSFKGLLAHQLTARLAGPTGVACSAGSACHSSGSGPGSGSGTDHSTSISPVLRAMGVPEDFARGTLRLSWGRHTTEQDIEESAARIAAVVVSMLSA